MSFLEAAGMKEMQTAPFVFQGYGVIAVCYVDSFLVLEDINEMINELNNQLSRDMIMKDLGF